MSINPLSNLSPLERAQHYVANLTAAKKRGVTITSAGQTVKAELTHYQQVVASLTAASASTTDAPSDPQTPTDPSTSAPSSTPWGAPIDLSKPATDTYTLAEQWYYATQNPSAAPAGSVFAQADNPGPALSTGSSGTYGQFQLGQLLGGIVGAGAQYFPTSVYPTIPDSVLQAGGAAYGAAAKAASGGTIAQSTYTPRPEAGG